MKYRMWWSSFTFSLSSIWTWWSGLVWLSYLEFPILKFGPSYYNCNFFDNFYWKQTYLSIKYNWNWWKRKNPRILYCRTAYVYPTHRNENKFLAEICNGKCQLPFFHLEVLGHLAQLFTLSSRVLSCPFLF